MTRITILAAAGLVTALAACEPQTTTTVVEAQTCRAAEMQALVGQPGRILDQMTLPAGIRVIRPGMAVTLDHNPTRTNVEIDDAGRISKVACG